MIEALLIGLGNALVFGIYFSLSIVAIVVTVLVLIVAILYWLELKEMRHDR